MRALSANRQTATMTQSAVATDVHQPLDVHLDALAQVAFNFSLRFENRTDPAQLVLAQILDASVDDSLQPL